MNFEGKIKLKEEVDGVKSYCLLIDAENWVDAETKMIQYMDQDGLSLNDFEISDIKISKVNEVVSNDRESENQSNSYCLCCVSIIQLNDNGKLSKRKEYILVQMQMQDAYNKVMDMFAGSSLDFEIIEIKKSNIINVI